MIVDVYGGFSRNTIAKIEPKIINDFVMEIPCLECKGTGVWDFYPPDMKVSEDDKYCIQCKGTGKQYIGI